MPTIFQYKALSNIFEAAKLKYPVSKFDSIDRELFSMGVRVGQIWAVTMPQREEQRYISFLGYHEKGFLFLQMRDADSRFRLGNNPVITKKEILKSLQQESPTSHVIKSPPATLLDDNGIPLPGNEIDVMMHGMGLRECTWLSPVSCKHKYLYTCKNGHFICSDRLPNDFIVECTKECWESKADPELRFYIDNKIGDIVNGKYMKINASSIRSIDPLCRGSFNPFETDKTKCIEIFKNIPRAITSDGPLHKTENIFSEIIGTTAEAFIKRGIKSGDSFLVKTGSLDSSPKLYVKIHFRECGATHLEFSRNKIFTGSIDKEIINMIMSGDNPRIQINRSKSISIIRDQQCCIAKCPVCRTPSEFILKPLAPEISFKTSKPINLSEVKDDKVISVGSFVSFRDQPAIVHKLTVTPNGLERAVILDKRSKLTSARPKTLKQISPTAEMIRTFYDHNNILKKKTLPERWHELVLQGSRLRVRKNISDIEKKEYAGRVVTVMGTPMRLSDTEWGVNVIEAEEIFNLNRELLPLDEAQIYRGMVLNIDSKELTVEDIADGYIKFAEEDQRLPEPAIHLLINRNKITTKMIYTVDSLL